MLSVMLAASANASPSYGGNCALYARQVTGVELAGDAGAWWGHAEGRYQRGHEPTVGAVLVFRPSGHMRHGHVAVVSRVIGRREILVDQANWIRGRIVKNMSVVDASPNNDWTSVKVVELSSRTHGRENATYGFIYPTRPPPHEAEDRVIVAGAGQSKTALPVRLAVATGNLLARHSELQHELAERLRVQPATYHPADEPKTKRGEREASREEVATPKAKRTERAAKTEGSKTKRSKAETEKATADAKNPKDAKKPKAEKHEARHRKDPEAAKTKREKREQPQREAEKRVTPDKRDKPHTDSAKVETKRQAGDTRHASAADSPKPDKVKAKSVN
jgi:surface antigen